jgi:hypothetical protein
VGGIIKQKLKHPNLRAKRLSFGSLVNVTQNLLYILRKARNLTKRSSFRRGFMVTTAIAIILFSVAASLLPQNNQNKAFATSLNYKWGVGGDAPFTNATTNNGIDFATTPNAVQQTLPAYSPQGDGHDGALTVSSPFNININTNGVGGRVAADGVIWTITNNVASGQATITSGGAVPAGIAANDEIMIINLKGTTSDYSNVGNYEFKKVKL